MVNPYVFSSPVDMSIIDSIQPFSITISGVFNTATISSVNTSNSVIIYNNYQVGETGGLRPDKVYPKLVLTNSTTVTASVNSTNAGVWTVIVTGYVVEFKSSVIQSVQTGNIDLLGSISKTATISAVTLANSAVLYAGNTTADTGAGEDFSLTTLELTNTTTVTARRSQAVTNAYIQYFVIEFKPGYVTSRNEVLTQNEPSNPTGATIAVVDLNKTVLFYGGSTVSSASVTYRNANYMGSSTQITCISGGGLGSVGAATAIEFTSGIYSVQNGSITIGAVQTSNTASISSVDTSKSMVVFSGSTSNAVSFIEGRISANVVLSSATVVTATRSITGGGDTITVYFQVVTFV